MIDGRLLDSDERFRDYCKVKGIKDPFEESLKRFRKRSSKEIRNGFEVTVIRDETEEEKEQEKAWLKERDEFLKLSHTFRAWDCHFWMDWERFHKFFESDSIYMPCDCVDRQCNMVCPYFGGKCPREKEEIKIPESLGFEGRWEFHDDD